MTIVLGILAMVIYLIPGKTEDQPARVVFESKGGRVIFSHQVHAEDYGFSCEDCHHEDTDLDPPLACGECHLPQAPDPDLLARTDAFHQQCMECHEQSDAGPFGENSCNQCHAGL